MLRPMSHIGRAVTAIRLAFAAHRDLLLEVLAPHHQLAVLARSNRRFRTPDRLLWLFLRRVWPQWRNALRLVQPATVDPWHRDRVERRWWRRLRRPGSPPLELPVGNLIRCLADENHLWGAPRIHGELLKLGIVVSERTVSRYLHGQPRTPSQTWRTFLANHLAQVADISELPSPDESGDDVVDLLAGAWRERAEPHWRCASPQCSVVDWPASGRRSGIGGDFAHDHLRHRTGMRRRTGRSPPSAALSTPASGSSSLSAMDVCHRGRGRRSACTSRRHDRQLRVFVCATRLDNTTVQMPDSAFA